MIFNRLENMCGLLGISNFSRFQSSALHGLALLNHRGPDASNYHVISDFFLGHTRLNIIDDDINSNQPFTSKCGNYTIIFNGEIYNYKALASEHLSSHSFVTKSDTEVLVELWAKYQLRCLELFDGMFSFAVYSKISNTITIARDIFGIKPLYYSSSPFAFSSEIRPLQSLFGSLSLDNKSISRYLYFGLYESHESCFFEQISSLLPGTTLTYDLSTGSCQTSSYFEPIEFATSISPFTGSFDDACSILHHQLNTCLSSCIPDNRDFFLNLSGGIDSSLTNFLVSEIPSTRFPISLSQVFAGTYDANILSSYQSSSNNHLFNITEPVLFTYFKDVLLHQELPFGGFPVIGYAPLYDYASSNGYKVGIDANGLDEFFLGYDKYLGSPSLESLYKHTDGTTGLMHAAINTQFLLEFPPSSSKLTSIDNSLSAPKLLSLNDIFVGKLPRALRFNDRVSMQFSIELRVPYIRRSLLEFALSLPDSFLFDAKLGKLPIRKLLSHYTCDTPNPYAPKSYIQSPQSNWLTQELAVFTRSILLSESFLSRPWIDADFIHDFVSNSLNIERRNSFFIWQWLNLELWARSFGL